MKEEKEIQDKCRRKPAGKVKGRVLQEWSIFSKNQAALSEQPFNKESNRINRKIPT